jgi:hypothetical protein
MRDERYKKLTLAFIIRIKLVGSTFPEPVSPFLLQKLRLMAVLEAGICSLSLLWYWKEQE